MLEWWIAAGVYIAVVVIAFARTVWAGLGIERNIRVLAKAEREMKSRSRVVRVVGTAGSLVEIGRGKQLGTILDLTASAFELRHDDGSLYAVAEGVRLTVITSDVAVDESGKAFLRANAELLYLPENARADDGPLRAAGALAAVPGDSFLLFARDTPLFTSPRRVHRLAWPRVIVVFGGLAAVLVMSALHAPASRWNALELGLLVMLLMDQIIVKGMLMMYLCSRAP